MKKIIIIVAAIIVLAVVGGVIFMLISNSGNGGQGGGTGGGTGGLLPPVVTSSTASTTLGTAPTGSTFQIGTAQGSVTVNNIYKNNAYITQDGQTVEIADSDNYSISYSVQDSGFIISLESIPAGMSLQDARTAAETVFLQKLGVSEADACKLTVQEGVSDKSSQYYGQLMGLSFCGQ